MSVCRYCKYARMDQPELGPSKADCIARLKFVTNPLTGMAQEAEYSHPLCGEKNRRGRCYDFESIDKEHEGMTPRLNLIKGLYYWLKWGNKVILEDK